MSDYNNELLNDCAWFANQHRGKNKQAGPHWSTIIRFTPLFDEAVRLQKRVDTLEAYISDFTPDSMKIAHLTARVRELEDANRWIPVSECVPGEGDFVEVDYGNDEMTVGSWFEEEIDHDEHESFPPVYQQWECWNYADKKFVCTDPPKRWRNLPMPTLPEVKG